MTDRELMKQVMENICGAKLCEINSMSSRQEMLRLLDKAIYALQERLAKPKQEPVAWRFCSGTWLNREIHWRYIDTLEGAEGLRGLEPLYAAPRPWVGLTDEERENCLTGTDWQYDPESYAVVIEAKLKEKNT